VENADKYIKDVVKSKLLGSARDIFGADQPFIFQQDGAPCQYSKEMHVMVERT